MAKPFPQDPFLQGYPGPLGLECDAPDLVVEGELPRDLLGSYYRNGPDPLYPPRAGDQYHWFHGDGMIQCFHFENGRVSWRNRWVKTDKYKLERIAGQSLFGVLGNPMTADPSVANVSYNTANTHIVAHHGKLLALMEGAPPVEIAHRSLDTVKTIDFDGKLHGPVTAHPKFDPVNGEMIFFGYSANGPGSREIRYNVVDKHGKLLVNEMIIAPFSAMVHDFMVTQTHVIFPVLPLTFSIERAIEGGLPLAWEPDRGSNFGVMPRNGTAADVRWYTMEARFMFHMVNAWNEGNKLVTDVIASAATQFAPMPDGQMAKEGTTASLRRWTIDLAGATQTVNEQILDDLTCEFPRTDDRYMTIPHRHAYVASSRNGNAMFSAMAHYDRQTGKRVDYDRGAHFYFGEPIVVPRAGSRGEADGYILVLSHNQETNLTDLLVLDAANIDQGPLATVKLPVRIPAGFHGSWVEGDLLAG